MYSEQTIEPVYDCKWLNFSDFILENIFKKEQSFEHEVEVVKEQSAEAPNVSLLEESFPQNNQQNDSTLDNMQSNNQD